jgi:hypothetical protein
MGKFNDNLMETFLMVFSPTVGPNRSVTVKAKNIVEYNRRRPRTRVKGGNLSRGDRSTPPQLGHSKAQHGVQRGG